MMDRALGFEPVQRRKRPDNTSETYTLLLLSIDHQIKMWLIL